MSTENNIANSNQEYSLASVKDKLGHAVWAIFTD